MNSNFAITGILVCLLLYRRIMRGMKFQKFKENVLIIRVVLFGIFALIALTPALLNQVVLVYDSMGIIAGLVLAYFATKHAVFEKKENVLYFKTHIWVEIIVIALFVFRFAYRLFIINEMAENSQGQQDINDKLQYLANPYTAIVFYIFCTYYVAYFLFILKEGKAAIKAGNIQESKTPH